MFGSPNSVTVEYSSFFCQYLHFVLCIDDESFSRRHCLSFTGVQQLEFIDCDGLVTVGGGFDAFFFTPWVK